MISRSQSELGQITEVLSSSVQIEPYTRHKCQIAWVESSLELHLHRAEETDELADFSYKLNQFYSIPANRRTVVTNPGMTGKHSNLSTSGTVSIQIHHFAV